jgi:hypothetical protein
MTQKGDRFNTLATNRSEGTVKMEEVRLQQTIARHFLRLASRTHRLRVSDAQHDAQTPPVVEQIDRVKTFVVLPRGNTRDVPHWLIELHFIEPLPPMGIEVADTFTIGIMRYGDKRPDLDLRSHVADEKGVSRQHVRLEPEHDSLCLTDLASTNGTWINRERIPGNRPIALRDGDVISLGGLSFILHIVSTPADLGLGGIPE